jgi:hypothetical protein
MRHGNLNRDAAIKAAGIKVVEKVEALNCDFTNRLQTDGDTDVEFSASVNFTHPDGGEAILTAYYYQDEDDVDVDDLGSLKWEIHGYEII